MFPAMMMLLPGSLYRLSWIRQRRVSAVALWTVRLLGEPEDEVGTPVADVAADLEAAGPAAEVAPVAEGAFGDAEEGAGLLEAEHLVAGVPGRAAVVVGVDQRRGHGVLLDGSTRAGRGPVFPASSRRCAWRFNR